MNTEHLALRAARLWMPTLVLGVLGWWALMLALPASRGHFLPAAMGDGALWAFLVPDLCFVALPTVFAWRQIDASRVQARWTAWLVTGALAYSAVWSLAASLWAWQAPLGPMLMLPAAFVQAVVAWTLQPPDRWFRVAEPASVWVRAGRTVADAALFTGAFLVVALALIRLFEDTYGLPRVQGLPWAPVAVAIVMMNLGGLVSGLWLVKDGEGTPLPVDTAAVLVATGPYAYIRNPMAALGIAQGVLAALALGSPLTLAYALFGGVFWHVFVGRIEEEDLERRFGEAYVRYRGAVPLWIPRLRPWRP